jgi:hypothetical protein
MARSVEHTLTEESACLYAFSRLNVAGVLHKFPIGRLDQRKTFSWLDVLGGVLHKLRNPRLSASRTPKGAIKPLVPR